MQSLGVDCITEHLLCARDHMESVAEPQGVRCVLHCIDEFSEAEKGQNST